jgi:hypothetical protein
MDFAYAGGGTGKAADVTLLVDGKQVAKGHIPQTVPPASPLTRRSTSAKTPALTSHNGAGEGEGDLVVMAQLEITLMIGVELAVVADSYL